MIFVKYVAEGQVLTIMTEVICLIYRKIEAEVNYSGSAENQKL